MKASKFQFLNPYLEEVSFVTNHNFIPETNDEGFELQNSFNIQINKSEKENKANVALLLNINTENENTPFRLQIKVASDFKWEDLDEKTVDSMLNHNAPALLLGYMRPIVANITNSSNFPVYNLPFINFKE